MNNGDKILAVINADCENEISKILADCDKTCAEILNQAKKQAEAVSAEINTKSQKKAEQMRVNSKNHAELEIRNMLLLRRRQEIDLTFNNLLNYLLNLDAESYFNIIFKLTTKLINKEGVMFFNQKDLDRLPKNFQSVLNENDIKAEISNKPADISGGFILKCGDIEENMSFSALLTEKRDKLEDFINRQLFN